MELRVLVGLLLVPDGRAKRGSGCLEPCREMHTHPGNCPSVSLSGPHGISCPRQCHLASALPSLSTVLSCSLAWFVSQVLSFSEVFPAFCPSLCVSSPPFFLHITFFSSFYFHHFPDISASLLLHFLSLQSPFSAPFSSAHILSLHSHPFPLIHAGLTFSMRIR